MDRPRSLSSCSSRLRGNDVIFSLGSCSRVGSRRLTQGETGLEFLPVRRFRRPSRSGRGAGRVQRCRFPPRWLVPCLSPMRIGNPSFRHRLWTTLPDRRAPDALRPGTCTAMRNTGWGLAKDAARPGCQSARAPTPEAAMRGIGATEHNAVRPVATWSATGQGESALQRQASGPRPGWPSYRSMSKLRRCCPRSVFGSCTAGVRNQPELNRAPTAG